MTSIFNSVESLLRQISLDKDNVFASSKIFGFTISCQDLKGIVVRFCKAWDVTFEQVDLRGSVWYWDDLTTTTFRECDLRGSQFLQVASNELSFDNCAVDGMTLAGSRLNQAFFNQCDGAVNLSKSDASGSCFIDCDMQRSSLNSANLSHSVFTDTDLFGSDFTNCLVKSTSFNRCQLTNCNFQVAREPGSITNYIDCVADPIVTESHSHVKQLLHVKSASLSKVPHPYVEPTRGAKLICSSVEELQSNKSRVTQ